MAWSPFNLPCAISLNPPGGSYLENNNSSPIANSLGHPVSRFPFTTPDYMNGHAIASYSPEYHSDSSTVLAPPQFNPPMGHNALQGNLKRHGDSTQLEKALLSGYGGLNDSIFTSVPSTDVLSTHQDDHDQPFEDRLVAYRTARRSSSPPPLECCWKGCKRPRPFSDKGTLLRHIKTQHVDPYSIECPNQKCLKMFSRKENMEAHFHRIHQSNF